MKIFWAIIGVCVLLGAAWLGVSFAQHRSGASRDAQPQPQPQTPIEQPAQPRMVPSPPDPAPTPAPPGGDPPKAAETDTNLEKVAAAQEEQLRQRLPNVPVTVTPEVKAEAPDVVPAPSAEAAKPDVPKPGVAPPAPKPQPEEARSDELPAAGPTPIPQDLPSEIGGYKVSPAEFTQKPDGSLLVDGRFVVKGLGTHDHPYEIPWELMTSVEQLFDPRSGKKEIPGRVAFLNAKHVRVSGYIAFPVLLKQPRELLAMLNQWDGCCIGVPPTPYDAVEVQLNKAVTGNNLTAIAGGVVGLFQVKPYVMGDWLVGLYLMEKAEFNPTDFGGLGGY